MKGKVIHVTRDPRAIAVSAYPFFKSMDSWKRFYEVWERVINYNLTRGGSEKRVHRGGRIDQLLVDCRNHCVTHNSDVRS